MERLLCPATIIGCYALLGKNETRGRGWEEYWEEDASRRKTAPGKSCSSLLFRGLYVLKLRRKISADIDEWRSKKNRKREAEESYDLTCQNHLCSPIVGLCDLCLSKQLSLNYWSLLLRSCTSNLSFGVTGPLSPTHLWLRRSLK